jgi:fatty acid hydroxylase domain-containing protein 2
MVFTLLLLEFSTICSHSGYNLAPLPSNLQHDFHHFAFDENFGPLGILDTLHGTNSRFKRTMQAALRRAEGDEEVARNAVLERLAQLSG